MTPFQGSPNTTIGQEIKKGTDCMQHGPLQMPISFSSLPNHFSELRPRATSLLTPYDSINPLQSLNSWANPEYLDMFEELPPPIELLNDFSLGINIQYNGPACICLPGVLENGAPYGYSEELQEHNAVAPAVPQPSPALTAPPPAVPIPAQTGSQRHQKKQVRDERLKCPEGCEKTFRRAGDYRRHLKMHATPMYRCPVNGCDKKFHRKDKAFDHSKVHETRSCRVLE
jgi:uncharacterized C2H2 Zn-finger protein